jgi:hypothetical protein
MKKPQMISYVLLLALILGTGGMFRGRITTLSVTMSTALP